MKIVLDTNVIVSALMTIPSLPARILNLVLDKTIAIVYDNRILAEYIDVLNRKELKINKEASKLVIDFISRYGEYILAEPLHIKFTDETDQKFYEVYKSGEAQYLVTGNLNHYPNEEGIVVPRKFLDQYAPK
ncbi:MAG: putative toxin-antitoxin system toxin component, PIN family [Treponema sp.]|jgi:putative PIN family toxin of toxin-antitoxin system|nr:putative toxin-antitoxin system toxin component, PIN family [Treponema sp.]